MGGDVAGDGGVCVECLFVWLGRGVVEGVFALELFLRMLGWDAVDSVGSDSRSIFRLRLEGCLRNDVCRCMNTRPGRKDRGGKYGEA